MDDAGDQAVARAGLISSNPGRWPELSRRSQAAITGVDSRSSNAALWPRACPSPVSSRLNSVSKVDERCTESTCEVLDMTLPTGSAASPRTPAARPRRYCLHASRLRAWVIGAVVLGPRWTTPFTAGKPRDCGSGRGPAAGRGERQLDCAHSRLRDPARSPAAEPAGRSKVDEKCMRSACEVLDLTPLSGLGASPRSHDHISPARRAYRRVSRCIDGKLNGEMPSQMSKNAACQVQPACRTQSPCTAQPRQGAAPRPPGLGVAVVDVQPGIRRPLVRCPFLPAAAGNQPGHVGVDLDDVDPGDAGMGEQPRGDDAQGQAGDQHPHPA